MWLGRTRADRAADTSFSQKNAAALKLYKKQFYSCTSCRWSNTGFGCCYCNPSRHEALLEKKKRLAKELMDALKKGLEQLVARGMIPAEAMETHEVVDPTKTNEGGGDLRLYIYRLDWSLKTSYRLTG